MDGKSFVDINVHYIDKDFKPKKKILDVLEMTEDKTAPNYRNAVDTKLEEFQIKDKVFSFTTDNENTMRVAFSDEERNGCFAHIESKSSKRDLLRLREMCSRFIRYAPTQPADPSKEIPCPG